MVSASVSNAVFTIFSRSKWRIQSSWLSPLWTSTVLASTYYLFSRKILILTLNSPIIYSYGLIVDHMPWRKSKPGFRTPAPACLPKLQAMCTLFFFFFNSKHETATIPIFIGQFNHESNVSCHWSKAVLRHLIYRKDCQMGHEQPFLPSLETLSSQELRTAERSMSKPHNCIFPHCHLCIKI